MADQALVHGPAAAIAKLGVLLGSVLAAALGALVLGSGAPRADVHAPRSRASTVAVRE